MGEVSGDIHRKVRKRWRRGLAAVIVIALTGAVLTKTARDTMGDPLVRAHPMSLPGLSPASGPTRVLLMSDIHVAGPDMTPERLTQSSRA
jgi:hypothetical protein